MAVGQPFPGLFLFLAQSIRVKRSGISHLGRLKSLGKQRREGVWKGRTRERWNEGQVSQEEKRATKLRSEGQTRRGFKLMNTPGGGSVEDGEKEMRREGEENHKMGEEG